MPGGPGEERGAREELAEIGGADRVRALHEEPGPARRRLERLDAGGPGDAEEVPVVRHAAAGLAEEHDRREGGHAEEEDDPRQLDERRAAPFLRWTNQAPASTASAPSASQWARRARTR